MNWTTEKKVAVGFGLALVILILNMLVAYRNTRDLVENNLMVGHSQQVLRELEGLLATANNAQTGQRGYILTGEESYLEPYRAALSQVAEQIHLVKELTADQPSQQRRALALERQLNEQLERTKEVIALRREQGFEAAQQVVATGQGEKLMDQIRTQIAEMKNEEHGRLNHRNIQSAASAQFTILTFTLAIFLDMALLWAVYFLIRRDITERRRAAEKIAESEQRLRTMIESEPECVKLTDVDGTLLEMNPAGLAMVEADFPAEVLGQSVFQLVTPEYRAAFQALTESVFQGETGTLEFEIAGLKGTHRQLETHAVPLRNGTDHVIALLSVTRDITERKRAEEALRQSEEAFRTLTENMSAGVYIYRGTRFIYVNPAMEMIYGYSRREMLAMDVWELVHPDFLASTRERLQARARGEEVAAFYECKVLTKTGQERWVEAHSAGIEFRGEPAVLGTVFDITERKQAEQERERFLQSEQAAHEQAEQLRHDKDEVLALLHTLLASAPIGVAFVDRQMRYIQMNDTFAAINGAPIKERLGRTVREVFPDIAPRVEARYHKVIETGEPIINLEISGTDLARATPGEMRYWLASYYPVRDPDGQVLGVGVVILEITEQKRAEEEVKRLNAGLEQRVSERTAQLEAANHELEAFSYSVSHDLRAPLRAITGFSQILREDYTEQLDAEGHRYLGIICENTKQMGQLIDDLLAFSRISRQWVEKSHVDLTNLARSVAEELKAEEPERDVTITIQELPPAQGDRALLRQVFVNLLSNAWKFTRSKPHPVIEVGSQLEGGRPVIYVKDNGAGFEMQYAHKLFGVFQRLHHKEEFEGTGVGLAIVHRIITRHGGRIWAESEVGHGATFYFTLPEEGNDHGEHGSS